MCDVLLLLTTQGYVTKAMELQGHTLIAAASTHRQVQQSFCCLHISAAFSVPLALSFPHELWMPS